MKKIRFLKNVSVDAETKYGEVYSKSYSRWQEIRVEDIYTLGQFSTIKLDNGDVLENVPVGSFEQVKEEKKVVSL